MDPLIPKMLGERLDPSHTAFIIVDVHRASIVDPL